MKEVMQDLAKLPASPWWSFLTTLAGAVIGAVVAGLIAYYIAKKNENARQKILIISVWMKLQQMLENSLALHKHLKNCLSDSQTQLSTEKIYPKITSFAVKNLNIKIAPSELSALANDDDIESIEKILSLGRFYNFLITTFRESMIKKERLTHDLQGKIDGNSVLVPMHESGNEMNIIPIMELESQIRYIIKEAPETYMETRNLMVKLESRFQRYAKSIKFDSSKFPQIDDLNQSE